MQAVKWVVAKLQGEITMLLSADMRVVAKLQGDESASQSSMEQSLLPMDFWTPPRFLKNGNPHKVRRDNKSQCRSKFTTHSKFTVAYWNCLQWGRSNLVDPAGWPKIGLLNWVWGVFCEFFLVKTPKHRVH